MRNACAGMSDKKLLYKADITAGSLKVRESRIVADMLLKNLDKIEWETALYEHNVLQVRNPATSRKYVRLIRQRLELMNTTLWQLIRDGSAIEASHAILATAIKHSRLLGDFMDLVVRDQYRIFQTYLTRSLWDDFLDDCKGRDPTMPNWSESTKSKLRRVIFHMLAQAGYLENTKSLKLQPLQIAPNVLKYLEDNNETYVLRCIQVSL